MSLPLEGRAIRSRPSKLFLVDADARLFKGKNKLSLGEQSLYMTMRSLADGQTGELAINGHALDWRFICREAQIGRCTWLKRRRGLIAAGLLFEHRERVAYFDHKVGRLRTVLAETHYFIRRQAETPKTAKKPTILLKSTSSTVEEVDPQFIQTHPEPSPRSVVLGSVSECLLEPERSQSSSPTSTPKPDDDSGERDSCKDLSQEKLDERYSQRVEAFRQTVLARFKGRHDAELLELCLDAIEARAWERKIRIGSARYLETALENLLSDETTFNEIADLFIRRCTLRQKFMGDFDETKFSDEPDGALTKLVRAAIAAKGEA